MGKGKKQAPSGLIFLKGLLLAFAVYLPGQLLITLLVVKGAVGEESLFPAVAAVCLVAALAGGFLCGLCGVRSPAQCCVRCYLPAY